MLFTQVVHPYSPQMYRRAPGVFKYILRWPLHTLSRLQAGEGHAKLERNQETPYSCTASRIVIRQAMREGYVKRCARDMGVAA